MPRKDRCVHKLYPYTNKMLPYGKDRGTSDRICWTTSLITNRTWPSLSIFIISTLPSQCNSYCSTLYLQPNLLHHCWANLQPCQNNFVRQHYDTSSLCTKMEYVSLPSFFFTWSPCILRMRKIRIFVSFEYQTTLASIDKRNFNLNVYDIVWYLTDCSENQTWML